MSLGRVIISLDLLQYSSTDPRRDVRNPIAFPMGHFRLIATMRCSVGVLVLTVLALLSRAEISHIHGSESDFFLRDEDGRTRFFHGLNFVQKGFPW